MAWGLRYALGSGDYSPDLVAPTEADRLLKQHFDDVLTAEERAEYLVVSGFASEQYAELRRNAEALPEYMMPAHETLRKTYKNLGSIMNARGIILVDRRLKEMIETIERGRHQFWPLELRMPKNKVYPKEYFGFRIRNYVDAFRPDLSRESSFSSSGSTYTGGTTKAEAQGIVIDKSIISGLHVWRDRKLIVPHIYFSDELMELVKGEGLRIFQSFHFQES